MICVVKKLDIGKMYAVEKLSSYITRGVYTVSGPFHPFGGAVDIIVVQQPDGTFKSSPWYVRFGKFQGVLKTKEKVVNICVNGVDAGFHMYLDHKGEAYFLKESDSEEGGEFVISPPSSGDETDEKARSVRFEKAQSCNFDGEPRESVASVENGSGKIVARTNSRRSRIFGLMFGKRSTKENDQAANVERVSSLERAEIAADLLEMKWSTNLPSADCRADNSMEDLSEKIDFDARIVDNEMISPHGEGIDDNFGAGIVCGKHFEEVSIHNSPSIRADEEDLEINTSTLGTDGINIVLKESFNKNLIGDYPSSGLSTYDTFNESVGSCGEKAGDSFETNMVREVHFEETVTDRTPCLSSHEEVLETYTFETGDLGNRSEAISNSVKIECDECNVSSKRSLLNCSKFDSQSTSSTAVPNDKEEALDEKSDGEKEVTSFIYSETFESSTVRFDVSADQAHDTLNLSFGGDGQFEHHSEVLCKTSELICEVNSQPESDESTCKENYNGHRYQNLELFKLEGSSVFQNIQSDSPSNGVLQETITNGLNADPPSISHSSESEVICRERATEELSQKKETRNKPIEFIRNRSQIKEGKSTEPISHIPVSNEKSELQSNCTFTDSFILDGQAHEVENLGNGVNVEKSCLPNGVKESLEDEQFLFSDNDSFDARDIDPDVPLNDAAVETDDHLLLTIEGDVEEHGLEDINHEQSFEIISEVSGTNTSSIAIPRSKSHLGETNLLTKSVPIIRSHIHDIERSNLLHPLSCSLDLNSEKYDKDLQRIEISSSSKLKADSEGNVIEDNCTSEAAGTAVNAENEQKQDGTPINPAVELSLCKHLLFEGMGADAACRVFNAEKVNFEKFSTLGPSLVKNDRLVVKIGSRYFPWDAAAPIILGMASFGQEQIFEPQGMIAVDRDEKNLKGDPSRAIVPSGGSWRLWPFTFKKSKTISTVRSVPESTNRANVDAAPMKTQSLIGDDDIQRSKYIKKKVQSLTPTSEELASLNLKEGRNVVTFSFSTAMLGQQQVDARIYLWKWNTRIVISDVDGTITKSDVLGQFMPLVGIDWSQTGVAHLFSAIKENGYQLLFLSARAISQAYLTRQFLFNLKQDGKALPDGPVVISPDGLFPSLYREVIRRAPHEFKISCLEDIRVLFPPECNPFYAGFGNRDTDEISYVKVGIPKGKIFIINPKGEVAVNRRIDTRSYTSLHALVNSMFPPMSSAEQEDFNSWNYWKFPLPDVDI